MVWLLSRSFYLLSGAVECSVADSELREVFSWEEDSSKETTGRNFLDSAGISRQRGPSGCLTAGRLNSVKHLVKHRSRPGPLGAAALRRADCYVGAKLVAIGPVGKDEKPTCRLHNNLFRLQDPYDTLPEVGTYTRLDFTRMACQYQPRAAHKVVSTPGPRVSHFAKVRYSTTQTLHRNPVAITNCSVTSVSVNKQLCFHNLDPKEDSTSSGSVSSVRRRAESAVEKELRQQAG
jgi:hypothetical protein